MNSIFKVEWIRLLILIMYIGVYMRSMVLNSIVESMMGLNLSWSSSMGGMKRFLCRSSIVGGVVNTGRDNSSMGNLNRNSNIVLTVDSSWSKSSMSFRISASTSSSEVTTFIEKSTFSKMCD